jgi:hypothetical protein
VHAMWQLQRLVYNIDRKNRFAQSYITNATRVG